MQCMLLIYDDENVWSGLTEEERSALMDEYWAFTDEVKKAGKYVAGDALQPSARRSRCACEAAT